MAKTFATEATTFIETWLNHYFPLLHQPSLSVAITQGGKLIYKNAWGYANLEKQEKATPDHIYRIASHSKTFTAFLIGMLVDEGKLKLDEPLITYLPWLKTNKPYAELTLRHVLSHSTGTERDGDDSNFWSLKRPFPTKAELKTYFQKTKPVIEPGTRFKYSNYAYGLAGFVIEAATGEDYETLITRKILKPLKLQNTGVDNPAKGKKVITGYSAPFMEERYALTPYTSASGLTCVTGFHSTPSELATVFSHFLLTTTYISRKVQKELMHPSWPLNPEKTDQPWYGLGLQKNIRNNHVYFTHAGGYPGYITRTMACLELDVVISIAINSLNGDTLPIINTLYDILWHFKTERGTTNPLSKYEASYYYLWGAMHVVAGNNKLLVGNLSSPTPLVDVPWLIPHGKEIFLITNADGYTAIGQTAAFNMKGGKPASMRFASSTHTASKAEYLKHLQSLSSK